MVTASADTIELDNRSNNDYFGPIYVGEYWRKQEVIYDTMADWTILVGEYTEGDKAIPSNYDNVISNSSKPVYKDEATRTRDVKVINMGSYWANGKEYEERMCLQQEGSDETGRFCVNDFNYILADSINGNLMANGVLGLAPTTHFDQSFIWHLKRAGQIDKAILGLNFENPAEHAHKSEIHFGSFNVDEIEGGEEGVNYYSNLGNGKWGLLMDDFLYNGQDMTGNHMAHIALIDSGNSSIQLPATIFNNIKAAMQIKEPSVSETKVGSHTILAARKSCADLV